MSLLRDMYIGQGKRIQSLERSAWYLGELALAANLELSALFDDNTYDSFDHLHELTAIMRRLRRNHFHPLAYVFASAYGTSPMSLAESLAVMKDQVSLLESSLDDEFSVGRAREYLENLSRELLGGDYLYGSERHAA